MPQAKNRTRSAANDVTTGSQPGRRRGIHTHAFAFALGAVATFGVLVLSGLLDVTPAAPRKTGTEAAGRGGSSAAPNAAHQRRASGRRPDKDSRQARQRIDPMEQLRRINAINERNRRLMERRHRPPQAPYAPRPHTPSPRPSRRPGQPPQ